jgi:enamine deaminase RidA (YjgF/YER057c/UK114 family)
MEKVVNPDSLAPPRGYSNGMVLGPGRLLFVAGQIGWDRESRLVSEAMTAQFEQALRNVADVVREAGGQPSDVGRLTIYVTDKQRYIREAKAIGESYRSIMGKHFPAMALVVVAGLLEEGALVEIEATAVLPS